LALTRNGLEVRKYYGQSIGNINKQTDGYWGNSFGEKWVNYKFNINGYVNVLINAEIGYYQ
jgi:hypothetical protein